jgi:hypothetical protein
MWVSLEASRIATAFRNRSPLRNTEGGPQVLGSELTYLRRYAVLAALALAPEQDDDGKGARDRADQQARQRPVQRPEPSHPSAAHSRTVEDRSGRFQRAAAHGNGDGS